jgi:hypothetical protein
LLGSFNLDSYPAITASNEEILTSKLSEDMVESVISNV